MNKRAAAVADLRQLCQLALPARAVMPHLLEALHRVVHSATNLFDWVDADGQIVDYYTEGPYESEAAQLYFEEFYNRPERELGAAFSERVRRTNAVIDHHAPDPAFYQSDYYNLIWRPRGVHHSLEVVVRDRGRAVGALTLYRCADDAAFSEHDARMLAGVVPYIAQAVVSNVDDDVTYAPCGETGLVIAEAGGTLVYQSHAGQRLLYLARRSSEDTPSMASAAEEAALPDDVLAWCRAVAAQTRPGDARPPTLHRRSAWGMFLFRARWLVSQRGGSHLIAIEIERRTPVALDAAQAVQALPLSGRQRELCVLLAAGHSYSQIAERMRIATNTAISYARVVYDKLELSGREGLVRRLAQRS